MQKTEIVDIRLILKGEIAEKLLKIKEKLGLANNSEVLRFVINNYYEKEVIS